MHKEKIGEKNGLSVYLIQDEGAQDPRKTFDNMGTMICWHKRYNLGDKHNFETPSDFLEWYVGSGAHWTDSAGWDSGQVGFIYVTAETIKKEYGTKKDKKEGTPKARAERYLEGEVKTYDCFLTGDVWGYIVEDETSEHLDSCWGFYGSDYAKQEALEQLNHFAQKRDDEKEHVLDFIKSHS